MTWSVVEDESEVTQFAVAEVGLGEPMQRMVLLVGDWRRDQAEAIAQALNAMEAE